MTTCTRTIAILLAAILATQATASPLFEAATRPTVMLKQFASGAITPTPAPLLDFPSSDQLTELDGKPLQTLEVEPIKQPQGEQVCWWTLPSFLVWRGGW